MRECTFFVSYYHIPQCVLVLFMVVHGHRWPPDETQQAPPCQRKAAGVPSPEATIRTGYGENNVRCLAQPWYTGHLGTTSAVSAMTVSVVLYLISHSVDLKWLCWQPFPYLPEWVLHQVSQVRRSRDLIFLLADVIQGNNLGLVSEQH